MSSSPYLLSLSEDSLTLRDDTLRALSPSSQFTNSVSAFASTSDALAIASSSSSWTIGCISVFTTEPRQYDLQTSSSAITKLALSSDTTFAAVAYTDNTVQLLNVRSHQSREFSLSFRILSLSFNSQSAILSVCTAKTVVLFSVPTFRQVSEITPTSATRSFPRATTLRTCLTSAAISPLHPLLATSDDTGCVTVYDISVPSAPYTHAKFTSALRTPATTMCFSSTGVLAVAGFDKNIRLYDSHLKTLLFSIAIAAPATALSFHEDLIAVATSNSTISLIKADVRENSFVYHARAEAPESQTTALMLCPPCLALSTTKTSAQCSPKRRVDPLSQTFSDVESFLSRLPPLPPDKQVKQEQVSRRLQQRRSLPIMSKKAPDAGCERQSTTQLPVHLSASFLTDEQGSPPSSAGSASPVFYTESREGTEERQGDLKTLEERHRSPEISPLSRSAPGQGASVERTKSGELFDIGASVLRRAGVGRVSESADESDTLKTFRGILRQEMDVVRTDLHNDIVSIHSELVLLALTQSRELKEVVKERDETVVRLENEVRRLKADNLRLRRRYGLS
ncbi:unnamed protein product [Agarophyton chilense]|eukprot:gb/GEZJ01003517.1/.p1 GENE.gb/GEZJ01003517.1/~~gb/GEZJ01003517.1/.p1  ORF type:complete len:567 (+),score=74.69 gb/GEZJ01003517.1/:68-1768(+)